MKSLWIVVLLMSAVCGAQEKPAMKFSYTDNKGTICTCERDGFDAPVQNCTLAEGRTLSEMLNGLESGQRESYKREQEVLNKYFEEGHKRDAEWDSNHPVKQADKKPKRDFSVNYLSGQAPLESRVEKLEQRVKELEAENAKLRKELEPTKVKTLPPGRVINGVIEMHVERMGIKHVCTELIDGTLQCPNGFRTKFYNPEVWQSLCATK